MSATIKAPRAAEMLPVYHGFRAAQAFIETWWKIGDQQSDELATILGSMEMTASGLPLDQALWQDWLDAIDRTR